MELLPIFMITYILCQFATNGTYLQGSFFVTDGLTFPEQDSYASRKVTTECKCRRLCLQDPRCSHYCWISYPAFVYCRLTDKDTRNLTHEVTANGHFAFKKVQEGFVGEDNFIYGVFNELMNYPSAVQACSSLNNGFRVGIYKSQLQYDTLKSAFSLYGQKQIWVDLTSMTNGVTASNTATAAYALWGDGTPFNTTEISLQNLALLNADEGGQNAKSRFDGTNFIDKGELLGSYIVLCQKNTTTL